ncbi:BgTH12-03684 [Blumeria graminis f. sp. triticale]|uniref:Bgt-50171 n=2 Tax=Blumeria graminis TaxID=34373 RepID=A0A9X9L8H2_BLUGR|nr:BgTH12-03684 [Blumeria graminis f. sp. triticale]VCU39738.1 Bgt-50171 [Blumeria graminis f. sp. tritici]
MAVFIWTRFQAPKPWIVRAPSATPIDKVRTRTNDTRSKHERDTVEREAHGNKDSGSQWQRWREHELRIERRHMKSTE